MKGIAGLWMFSCNWQHLLTWSCICFSTGVQIFRKIWQPPQNSTCKEGDLKKVLTVDPQFLSDAFCWVHVNWCTYLYFRKTAIIIILKYVLGAATQNFVSWVTGHVGFAHLCSWVSRWHQFFSSHIFRPSNLSRLYCT